MKKTNHFNINSENNIINVIENQHNAEPKSKAIDAALEEIAKAAVEMIPMMMEAIKQPAPTPVPPPTTPRKRK